MMSLGGSELERLADEIYKDRRITGSVYCGNCGYNLHTLPHVYTCPECGNQYNARPLKMEGIFNPQEGVIPFLDFVSALLCGWAAYVFAPSEFRLWNVGALAFGMVFLCLAIIFAVRTYRRFRLFLKTRRIIRQIALDEIARPSES